MIDLVGQEAISYYSGAPEDAYGYGVLITINYSEKDYWGHHQIYIPDSSGTGQKIYSRSRTRDTTKQWSVYAPTTAVDQTT